MAPPKRKFSGWKVRALNSKGEEVDSFQVWSYKELTPMLQEHAKGLTWNGLRLHISPPIEPEKRPKF